MTQDPKRLNKFYIHRSFSFIESWSLWVMNVGERLRILIWKCFFFFFLRTIERRWYSFANISQITMDPRGRDGRESVWSDCSQILSEFILFRRDNYWKWIGRARNCSNSLPGKMSKSPLICRIVETLWDLELEQWRTFEF